MIKITKEALKEKITNYVQNLGMTNAEVAVRLNEEFGANDKEKLNAQTVAKLKEQLGIKGIKPKKKALFEFVEEDTENTVDDIDAEGGTCVEL